LKISKLENELSITQNPREAAEIQRAIERIKKDLRIKELELKIDLALKNGNDEEALELAEILNKMTDKNVELQQPQEIPPPNPETRERRSGELKD